MQVANIHFQMDPIDSKVEEIWNAVNEKSPQLMINWMQCFGVSFREGKEKSKEEVKMTLTQTTYRTDPEKNFLSRLMRSSEPWNYGYVDTKGYRKDRRNLAKVFIQVMRADSYWKNLVETTMGLDRSKMDSAKVNPALSASESQDNFKECTLKISTPLHRAARVEDVDEVKLLLEVGEIMQINKLGYTPLHFASMAIHPQPEIAKLLNQSENDVEMLNKQTAEDFGQNTALHIAAANVQVTAEFIQEFKKANSRLCNSKGETPFHVAAKSKNQKAIIYMLNTFSPTNNKWDVDTVDGGTQNMGKNTLIKICARKGNAEAVALLIKHGADISQGVLHEIVLESVKNPQNIKSLLRVYHSIVDNVLTWRNLEEKETEEEPGFLQIKGSEEYEERFRKTLIWLLTNRSVDHSKQNVFEYALSYGASVMVWEIIRTKAVFRIHGEKALEYVKDSEDGERKKEKKEEKKPKEEVDGDRPTESYQRNLTVFDITNFTDETSLDLQSSNAFSGPHKNGDCDHMSKRSAKPDAEYDKDMSEETALCSSNQTENEGSQQTKPNNAENRNFDEKRVPHKPYFTCLLSAYDLWRRSNILKTQPFRELIKPYIKMVQRFYFVLGLLQLIFMVSFTVYWVPTTCSLALMFNVSPTSCSNSTRNDIDDAMLSSFSQQRPWIAMLWLIWPLILLAEEVFMTYHHIRQSYAAHAGKSKKMALNTKELKSTLLRKLISALLRNLPLRIFCFMVFVWLYVYFRSESHESYVQVTSMVFLFGWITNLSFLAAVSKNVSISVLVLKEMTLNDISSFMLFFGFTVVGFSFAIYTMRISICLPNEIIHLHDTFFAVLSSAFGLGDFFDDTIADPTCAGASGSTQNLFEFVYLGYVCVTIIILLNILIAMLNNRYEKAKQRAENVWRFEMLFTMTALKSMKCFGCCPKLLTPQSYYHNKKFDRHYILLQVPVDEQLSHGEA